MKTYFVRTPRIIQRLFPRVTWRIEQSNSVYLTFDDGPNPEVTPMLLSLLKSYNIQATFFLLGKNADLYPELVQQIRDENHSIGYHCYEHIHSSKLDRVALLKNFKPPSQFPQTKLFRPPYGKLRIWQYHFLKDKFPLIGWSIMPGDFDLKASFQVQLNRLHLAKPGDIVVLHERLNTLDLLNAYLKETAIHSFEKL